RLVALVDVQRERPGRAGQGDGERREQGEESKTHGQVGCFEESCSNGRRIMDTVKYAVKRRITSTAAARPASFSFKPAAKIMSATSQPRPIIDPIRIPTV